jgi:hypothetical protein
LEIAPVVKTGKATVPTGTMKNILITCGKIEKLKLALVATENPMWMRSLLAGMYIFEICVPHNIPFSLMA